ncbi:hypothetical protein NP233_g1846 [Leucocoprinus birnbaumii]|uniref:Uncharacterized protein n=1 Tax=Leucocoprinus birnbaumii TaxID=56174 RepID=A0AAD5W1C6_9AGAR|nr:hypothetical protein NP233_g1846 [Leucocoprinus birnbaumii]
MYFSIKSLMIIWKANKKIQRSNRSLVFESVGNYTSMPPRSLKHGSVSILFKEPDFPPSPTNPTASSPTTANNYNFNSNINNFGYNFQSTSYAPTPVSAMTSITSAPSFVTANEYPPTPKATTPSPAPFLFATAGSQSPASPASPNLLERKFHLPFRPSMTGNAGMDLATESDVKSGNLKDVKSGNLKEEQQQQSEEDIEDDISSTLPEFRTPMPIPLSQRRAGKEKIEGSHSVRDHSGGGESDVSEVVWSRSKMDSNDYGAMEGRRPTSGIGVDARQRSRVDLKDDDSDVLGSGDVTSGRYMTPMEFISQPSEGSAARSSPNLAPAIWRIILFQTAFCAVQILVCISTIVDLATHRPTPTPLGTQHFALLLAAWGPAVVFGHSPAVRKSLKFW